MSVAYDIYQTNAPWRFRSWEEATELGFDMDAYEKVYTLEMPDGSDLEDVFTTLNIDLPADYRARSLSVSDVVGVGGRYYYCSNLGWIAVE